MVTLGPDALSHFPRFTLYNSPYTEHRKGQAIDLYPDSEIAPSPIAGQVRETKTTRCPPRPYAADHDHLIVLDTGEGLARILHVDPAVEPGETVERGDPLGELVRSGYFAQWVDNHVHLGFRDYGADPIRASGSLTLDVAVPIDGVSWDGTGTVVETGETYAILDVPDHPDPGTSYVGITDDSGRFVLDGGLPHYENGGIVPVPARQTADGGVEAQGRSNETDSIELLGTPLGTPDGRELPWSEIRVLANGTPITGLSFFFGRDEIFAKLICPDVEFAVGEQVTVELTRGSATRT